MKTSTKIANLTAAVAFLAASLSLPRAEAHVHNGQYFVSYQPAPGQMTIHLEATRNADDAFTRFVDATTNGKWLVMLVDEEEAGEVDPLIEYAHHNGTHYVGDRTGQSLPEAQSRYGYEVRLVSTGVAEQLAERYAKQANLN